MGSSSLTLGVEVTFKKGLKKKKQGEEKKKNLALCTKRFRSGVAGHPCLWSDPTFEGLGLYSPVSSLSPIHGQVPLPALDDTGPPVLASSS